MIVFELMFPGARMGASPSHTALLIPLFIFEPSHSAVEAINPHSSALPADRLKEAFAQSLFETNHE